METIFHKITKAIEKHDYIVLMGHKNIDMDAFGSCLGMYKIIRSFNIPCGIFMNESELGPTIHSALKKLCEKEIDIDIVTCNNYEKHLTENSLLIILDTHKTTMIEYPQILDKIKDVIVIDHHIKNDGVIAPTVIEYINSTLSSANEIIVEYLKYLNKKVSPAVATIMLVGIEIDTNGFNIKTTDHTYEAAAFLSKLGADHIVKQELLKENKEDYMKRQDFVKNSFMINKTMAMCMLDDMIHEKAELAMIAEELLKFEDVEASFAIGKLKENYTGVSARSVGKVDVEKIMTVLGGGGHKTDAAAQLENSTMEEVQEKIINILN